MEQVIADGARAALSPSKRALDLTASALLILFLAPLLALIGLAVAMSSPGPILFRQQRTGLGGESFEIFKFRSMYQHQPAAELQQAKRGDGRVTPVGALIRRTSLDELPQLLNVLRGDMSLVGPRPHALSHDEQFRRLAPKYDLRFTVRPGITGLAQVSGQRGEIRSPDDVLQRTALDLRYVETWTLQNDLRILIRTALVIFVDERAY